ncbi:TIGR03557 family F420-dependent LLM class oxidoreductase [Halorarum salinum]|uniref:TIGR03557 family F420-dependent LLM class oxidoreductase n=1 Tax=Halorarum salinum TaxID=2743089 RepID=A0A7D5LDB3_9EURY|nr:TIGR03557 family F420-dependent LLM class oxidoreductase [Halobaculum salinum]QLG64193.1 TIGR03557 family F420-dependent LLM class oxidoreductase [Halobaculum salinum]
MTALGYSLIGEEHGPDELVETAARAEDVGFEFALVSDHFHPWLESQGHSPFVWSTIGGIARETTDLEVGTGVTCPLFRIHPAIVAQAAATVATMLPDRFFLGVGTGENLNEHVLGDRFPPHDVRLERLAEAVEVIRGLWTGEEYSHRGDGYTVENAKLYTVPDDPPPIHVAASGPGTASAAGEFGDGFIGTSPDPDLLAEFREAGSGDRPAYGQVTVCWDESTDEARRVAHERWRNAALPGELGQVLPTPAHFEQATELVEPDDVAESVVCGPDADDHVERIGAFVDAGYDHVSVHQVGPRQEECLEFYESEVLPSFG